MTLKDSKFIQAAVLTKLISKLISSESRALAYWLLPATDLRVYGHAGRDTVFLLSCGCTALQDVGKFTFKIIQLKKTRTVISI